MKGGPLSPVRLHAEAYGTAQDQAPQRAVLHEGRRLRPRLRVQHQHEDAVHEQQQAHMPAHELFVLFFFGGGGGCFAPGPKCGALKTEL